MSDIQQMGLMLGVTMVTLAMALLHYWLAGSYQTTAMILPLALWQGMTIATSVVPEGTAMFGLAAGGLIVGAILWASRWWR